MKKFLNSFLDICIRWLPLLLFFFAFICSYPKNSSSFDAAASLVKCDDPVTCAAMAGGAIGWSIVSFLWYYLPALCDFIVRLFRKSSGKKSVDQKEV